MTNSSSMILAQLAALVWKDQTIEDLADALRACMGVLIACRDIVGSTPDELAAIALAEAALARPAVPS